MVKKIVKFDNQETSTKTIYRDCCHYSRHTTRTYYEINGLVTFVLVKSTCTYIDSNDICKITRKYFYNYKNGKYTTVQDDTVTRSYRTN